MAGGMDLGTHTRGGKKPLDAAINLVPFIDLMAVTISFLIMTAVWTQVGRISVSQSGGAGEPSSEPVIVLEAHLSSSKIELRQGSQSIGVIQVSDDAQKAHGLLTKFKQSFPQSDQVTLTVDDDVQYERVVRFIDQCLGVGLNNVSVSG